MRKSYLLILLVFLFQCSTRTVQKPVIEKTFTNPLLPSGADPWVIMKDGYYYYTNTTGNGIVIWKTKSLADLKTAEQKTVWTPPQGTMYSKELWAPEVHFLQGKWYVYFAADDGKNDHHRLYVLENASADPMSGEWIFKGKISDDTDKWAIDGSVYEYQNKLYMVWSGWEGENNFQQNIYIAGMDNPWTIGTKRVRISKPSYKWETIGDLGSTANPSHVDVNEGPEILMHKDRVFLIYSASGCWTDFYALGLLSLRSNGDMLDSSAWTKSAEPVFKQSPGNGVFAPGHNSFFKSPDGKEDWILYHANSSPGEGCGNKRSPRAQKFTWDSTGMPVFGEPVKAGVPLAIPSE
ncbi:MAG: glycoside hydrolase family 43 protein [Chitinophagaceae bacterium]